MTNSNGTRNRWLFLFFSSSVLLFSGFSSLCGQCTIAASATAVCGGETVRLSVADAAAGAAYSWDFDGDGDSDAAGPEAAFTTPQSTDSDRSVTIRLRRDGVECGALTLSVRKVPDPAIGIPATLTGAALNGNVISVCNAGETAFVLEIVNRSTTKSDNRSYRVDWGDGSPALQLGAADFNGKLSHPYSGRGYKPLTVAVTGSNGCVSEGRYQYFNGSNPALTLGSPGNTTGLCAPADLTFPIAGTAGNPPGTEYQISINGNRQLTYNQNNVPDEFTLSFNQSSCEKLTSTGKYRNAFDVEVVATNPCGSTTSTVEPIELSGTPVPRIQVTPPPRTCPGEPYRFRNATENIAEVRSGANSTCTQTLEPDWEITPGAEGVDWRLTQGSLFGDQEIRVAFERPGTFTVKMHIKSSACGLKTAQETVTVLEPPAAKALAVLRDNDGCAGEVIRFENRSSGYELSYRWRVSGSDWQFVEGTGERSKEPVLRIDGAGKYDLQLTVSNLCREDTWDTTIVLKGLPQAAFAMLPDVCERAVLDFTAQNAMVDGATSVRWEFPGAAPSFAAEPFPRGITYASPGTYPVVLRAANACGESIYRDTFRVAAPAVVTMPADRSFCAGDAPMVLTAAPAGGSWQGKGISAAGRFDPGTAGPGSHELTYTYGTATCQSRAKMQVTVNPLPAVDAGADLLVCGNGDPVTLSAGPPGGAWRLSRGALQGGVTFNPKENGPGSYTATYAFTDGNGCVGEDQRLITVRTPPVITVGGVTLCNAPGAVKLPAAQPAGGSWEGPGLVGQDQFDPAAAGGTGEYLLTYTFADAAGCVGSADALVRVVDPVAVEAGPDLQVCAGETALDLAAGAGPPGGEWREAQLGLIRNGLFDPAAAGPGIYRFTYAVGTGNCRVEAQRMVEVLALPAIDLGDHPESICVSVDSIRLAAVPAGGEWQVGNSGVMEGAFFFPARSGAGSYRLTYSLVAGNGCSSESSFDLVVNDLPRVTAAGAVYCAAPGLVELPPAQPAGGRWRGPGVSGYLFDPLAAGGRGEYRLTYLFADDQGCADSATALITVTDPFEVEAGPPDTLCVEAGPVTLAGFRPAGGRWSGPGITNESKGTVDLRRAGGGTHTYRYTVGSGNCEASDATTLTIIDLTATTAGPEQSVCLDASVLRLSGAGPGGGVWSGPGIVDSIAGIFDPALTGSGDFEISYRRRDDASGCAAAATKRVRVHALPTARFIPPAAACPGADIRFDNRSVGASRSRWDFGDGATSGETSPTHRYSAAGSYPVTLTVTSENGCSDRHSDTLFVEAPPTAAFTSDLQEGCAPLAVTFTNRSSGNQATYLWDFGDGRTAREFDPGTVVFRQGKDDTTYTVTLTVANQCAEVRAQQTVTVFPRPIAGFGVPVDISCTPMEVRFANNSTGKAEQFLWDLGNGRTSVDTVPATQVYSTDSLPSSYTITLVAVNSCGADTARRTIVVTPVEVEAFFHVPARRGCQPFAVPFTNYATPGAFVAWDFGDGSTSSATNPVHTFEQPGTYTVVQKAGNGCGYDSALAVIEVLPAPALDFSLPGRVCRNEELFITNLSENIAGYRWSFGDGATSMLREPVYRFDSTGLFMVTLQGTSASNGCTATLAKPVEVLPLPGVAVDVPVAEGCRPLAVTFAGLAPEASYFTWDFGDGNSGVGDRTVHTFEQAGNYSVRVVARAENGCYSDTARVTIRVHPTPAAAFSFERDRLCGLPVEISFANGSTGATGYRWEFGDGSQSTLNNPVHTFRDSGSYEVRLTAINEFGCEQAATRLLKGYPVPEARFEVLPGQGCRPLTVDFVDRSRNANAYYWSFGDGVTGAGSFIEHTYWSVGRYPVTLIAAYDDLCFDTLVLGAAVEVLPSPRASFYAEEERDSLPAGVFNFVNTSENAVGYFWDFGDGQTSDQPGPRHRYFSNGDRVVTLRATGANGCTHDTTLVIRPAFFSGLYVPNALSPEGGTGDARYFLPKGVGLSEYRLEIFSAYGDLIWATDKLEEGRPAEGWNGTRQGELLPQDVYVWKIFARFEDGVVWRGIPGEDGKRRTMGTVLLLR